MKKTLPLYILLLTLLSCNKSESLQEEILVIHSTFENAVYAASKNDWHDANRFGPKFPPAGSPKFKIIKDTALRAGKHIYQVKDSLMQTGEYGFSPRHAKSELEMIYQTTKLPTVYASLAKNAKTYMILSEKNALNDNDDYNGELTFSRVVFNKARNKAFYYLTQYIRKRGWGTGTFVYAEKRKGKWVFLKADEDWIV